MIKRIILYLISMLLWVSYAYASSIDQDYIQEYRGDVIASFFVSQQKLGLKISKDEGNFKREINYLPNTKEFTGIGLSYLWLGGSISWTTGATTLDGKLYGRSKYIDYQLNYYGRKFGVDANYQRYTSFYLDNPQSFYITWNPGDVYPQRSDLSLTEYTGNFYWIFSHDKFSLRAAFNQTERQKKKAGSFLLMSALSYLKIKSDYSLIPPSQEAYFDDLSGFRGGKFIALSLAPGYAYTFVWSKWYLTPSIFVGPGFQHQQYEVAAGAKRDDKGGVKGHIRLALGYNGDRFFVGFSLIADATTIKQGKVTVESSSNNSKAFIGYRFKL